MNFSKFHGCNPVESQLSPKLKLKVSSFKKLFFLQLPRMKMHNVSIEFKTGMLSKLKTKDFAYPCYVIKRVDNHRDYASHHE
uniref:Uncharacterized protein n=1 Tax=Rhizophora mucronata TaxID=61149 RepID=A0A2P2KXV1_RHIMU